MAILKSTTYTAQETAANNAGSYIDSAELISGKVSFLQCTYTAEAGTQAADYILLGYHPVWDDSRSLVCRTSSLLTLPLQAAPLTWRSLSWSHMTTLLTNKLSLQKHLSQQSCS